MNPLSPSNRSSKRLALPGDHFGSRQVPTLCCAAATLVVGFTLGRCSGIADERSQTVRSQTTQSSVSGSTNVATLEERSLNQFYENCDMHVRMAGFSDPYAMIGSAQGSRCSVSESSMAYKPPFNRVERADMDSVYRVRERRIAGSAVSFRDELHAGRWEANCSLRSVSEEIRLWQ